MNIVEAIGWKFNHQPGMRCAEVDGVMTIIEFPGGVPDQATQDTWLQEYNDYIAAGGLQDEAANIEQHFDPLLKAFALVVLDEINLLRTQAGLPARSVAQLKNAVKQKL